MNPTFNIVITGGSEGIGFSIAEGFIKQQNTNKDGKIILVSRSMPKLQKAKEQLQELSSSWSIHVVAADVTNLQQVQKSFADIQNEHGYINLLICSAGRCDSGYSWELGYETYDAMMKLQYFGSLHCIKECLPSMIKNKFGHIVVVSTLATFLGVTGWSAYSASKAAITSLADNLNVELQGSGVSFSLSFPPDTDSPGYQIELKTRMEETTLISAFPDKNIQVYKAEQVAYYVVHDLVPLYKYFTTVKTTATDDISAKNATQSSPESNGTEQKGPPNLKFSPLKRPTIIYKHRGPDLTQNLLMAFCSGLTQSPYNWFLTLLIKILVFPIVYYVKSGMFGIARRNAQQKFGKFWEDKE